MNELRDDHPAFRFLRSFCPDQLREEIEGDLAQQYERDMQRFGRRKAEQALWWNSIRYFRPGIISRNRGSVTKIQAIMLTNYLQVAIRNLMKNKVFSAINIFGLATGLASCLLIFQFVSFQLSFDTFNPRLDRIYRVTNDRFQNGNRVQHGTITYPTIGPTMARDFPEIEAYTRLMPYGTQTVKIEDKLFKEGDFMFVDEHFLDILAFTMIAGDKMKALKEPYAMVLTQTAADRYFGSAKGSYGDLLGKNVRWGNDPRLFVVTGICEDVPANSHLTFDALVSYATLVVDNKDADNSWTPYRIPLTWNLWIVPLLLIVGIAMLTVSAQVLKTAMTNPAETLKYE